MNLKNFLAWMCVLPIQVVMINLAMGMDPDSPVDFEIVTCFGCDFQQRKMLAIETAGHDSGFFKIVVFDPISEDADSFTVRIVVENEPGGSFTSTRVRTIAVPAEFQVAMGLYLEYMDIVESVEPVELPASFSNPPGQVTFSIGSVYDLNTGGTWETNEAAIIEYVITQLGLRATQAAMETFGDALVRWLTTKIAELLPKRITVIFPDGTSIVAVINSTFSFVPGHLDPSSALTANGQKIDLGSLPGGISALEGPDGFERPRASLAGIVGFKKCFRVTYVFPDPPYEERKGTQCEIIW